MTERDLDPTGDASRILAWDGAAGRPVSHDPAGGPYDGDPAHLALEGE